MIETNYNTPMTSPQEEESDIDIMELVSKLWKRRKLIIKWCIGGAIVGLIIAFSLPKSYSASVMLAPEVEQRVGSGVSSIASMMGVNLDNNVDAISYMMFPEVVASTPFIYELFDLPVQFERGDSIVNTDLLDYMLNYQKSPWWSPILGAPAKAISWVISLFKEEEEGSGDGSLNLYNLPKKERGVVKALAEGIQVNVDKKTGQTDMSLSMQDPKVVYTVLTAVVENLKTYMVDYRTSKVRADMGYPPLVTPTSQMVGVQAVTNVLQGERYKKVSKEIKAYCRGEYGRTPAPIDPEIQKLILGDEKPLEGRYADTLKPVVEDTRAKLGDLAKSDEDVLSYIAFPNLAEKFLEERKAKEENCVTYSIVEA